MDKINKNDITQAQKMMVFVLSMSLYGLSTLFTELIPKFQIGLVEISVEYFLFIPLTLGMLFSPLYAALGAAAGEVIFSEIMLGQFGGIGELEKFLTLTIGIFIAGKMVKNPKNKTMVGIAAMTGVVVQQAMGTIVDILKVTLAIEDFEAVAGLPESIYFTEGFAFFNDVLFSGILFCLIPTLYLVPRLYGKIEPLMGMKPRDKNTSLSDGRVLSPKIMLLSALGFLGAIVFELMDESGLKLIEWEFEWAESTTAIISGIIVAAVIAVSTIFIIRRKVSKKEAY